MRSVYFSRLLKIFTINSRPAYIIELTENHLKKLYISFSYENLQRNFLSQDESPKFLLEHFSNLSEKCLLSECVSAVSMFCKAPITHFETNCPKLKDATGMFCGSDIRVFKSSMKLLECACDMFSFTKNFSHFEYTFNNLFSIEKMFMNSNIKFCKIKSNKLTRANGAFQHSTIKEVHIDAINLRNANYMFSQTNIESFYLNSKKIIHVDYMFSSAKINILELNLNECLKSIFTFRNSEINYLKVSFNSLKNLHKPFYNAKIKELDFSSSNLKTLHSSFFLFRYMDKLTLNIPKVKLNPMLEKQLGKNSTVISDTGDHENFYFTRLLRIFTLNNKPAYIIEMKNENNELKLFLSYYKNIRVFLPFENCSSKNKQFFSKRKLSNHCLLNEQKDLSGIFENSPITHFEVDCPLLERSPYMFNNSKLKVFNSNMPKLNNGNFMFCNTYIKTINNDFPQLRFAFSMFKNSFITQFFSTIGEIEIFEEMFSYSYIKEIKPAIKIRQKNFYSNVFLGCSDDFYSKNPFYFL